MTARLLAAPTAPRDLSTAACTEWRRLAPLAVKSCVLTSADLPALALLCEAMAQEKSLRLVLAREGETLRTASGGAKAHPALKALTEARAQSMRLLGEFGLTPRGRATSKNPPPEPKPENPFSRLRVGKRAHQPTTESNDE